MAIPSSGRVSIGDLRTELQNTGTNNFSLKSAGRPTTGAPGTAQDPVYTPVNQSSSIIPNNSVPYSISEWRGYNHSENDPCIGEDIIFIRYEYISFEGALLYRYDLISNEKTYLEAGLSESDDFAITENKLFLYRQSFDEVLEYDITIKPWSITLSSNYYFPGDGQASGLFAKNNTTLIYWYTSGSLTYVREATLTPGNTTPSIQTLFTIDATTYTVYGELYYETTSNKYFLPYTSGSNRFVGRFSSTGTLEASVPIILNVDGIFSKGSSIYGVVYTGSGGTNTNDIYLLDFSVPTSIYIKSIPGSGSAVRGVSQAKYNTSFTSPALGTFYTYYRVQLRGQISDLATIDITGSSTTNHWCYIYTSYPFNNVGQINLNTAWTYSFFNSSTTKTFTRTLLNTSETLHFVLYQDQF